MAHYRSPLDFSNEGLKAAEKGLKKLQNAGDLLDKLKTSSSSTSDINALRKSCFDAMNDDMNTAIVIANLFEAVRIINSVYAGTETISEKDLAELKKTYKEFTEDILGLVNEEAKGGTEINDLMSLIVGIRNEAKQKKDFSISDKIRDELNAIGFKIKDEKDGTTWTKE
jgi:cysteinyl-tRNA synthetase